MVFDDGDHSMFVARMTFVFIFVLDNFYWLLCLLLIEVLFDCEETIYYDWLTILFRNFRIQQMLAFMLLQEYTTSTAS